MRFWKLLLAAVVAVAVQHVAYAQQTPIEQILDKSNSSLEKNLKTLDNYYQKIREKSGGDTASGTAGATANNSDAPVKTSQASQKSGPQVFKQPGRAPATSRSNYERDPFAYTDRIRLNDPVFGGVGVSYSPKPINSQSVLPRMTMKGFLSGGEENSIGLLEIEGMGVQVVRKGDVVGLQQVGLDAVVRIIDMSSLGLIVETGSSGQAIVVR